MKNSKTKKQSILVAVLAFLLVGVLAVGMSSAWFRDAKDSGTATITMGDEVKIETVTSVTDLSTGVYLPGDTIYDDNLAVTLKSTEGKEATDSLVRVKVVTTSGDAKADDLKGLVKVDEATAAGWFKVGDYYYYNKVVTPITAGEVVNFKWKATVPTTWENEYANQAFTVKFEVEAVQAKNVDMAGHPFGEAVKVEGTTVSAKTTV